MPAILALALAALAVAAVFALLNADRTGVGDVSPTPSASPSATPEPEWLAALVREVERDCGEELAQEFEADARTMDEEEARDAADELRESCADNGRGNGRGNGNGGGGNSGPGGGDD